MAVVEFEYAELKEGVNLTKEKMVDILNNLGAPAEVVGERIVLELTPNRPDWFSKEGILRSMRAYCNGTLNEYKIRKKSGYVLNVGNVPIRQCAAWAVVRNLKFNDQKIRDIVLLQDKLNATLGRRGKRFGIGFYPLQNIEFPIRYTLMKPEKIVYWPLNYPRVASASEILENHPKGKEFGHLLKGQKEYPVYVDGKDRIMCLIPIVNSAETGKVDEKTTEVLVEVTGTHQEAVNAALNIICCSLIDAGGGVESMELHAGKRKWDSPDLKETKIKLDVAYASRLLGVVFSKGEIKKLLRKMGYRVDERFVYVPPYRADVLHFVDVIEDIAIAYGYNKFEVTLPNFFSKGKVEYCYQDVHSILRGMGFTEIKTFVLSSEKRLSLVSEEKRKKVLNPCTEDFGVIRDSLLIDAIEVFERNKTMGLPQKIYEIGEVYKDNQTKTRVVFGVMSKNITFSDFRGYLQTLLAEKGISFELKKNKEIVFDEKECGLVVGDTCNGVLGKVSNKILRSYNVEFPIYLCELVFV